MPPYWLPLALTAAALLALTVAVCGEHSRRINTILPDPDHTQESRCDA